MPRAATGEPLAYLLAVLTTMPGCTAGRWPHYKRNGYGWLRIDGRHVAAHVAVCTWYHGPRPEGQQVRHLCGLGHLGCFSPGCLTWGTAKDNAADRVEHGNQPSGNAKLRLEQAVEIRRRYAAGGVTQQALGAEYGVSKYIVWAIVHNHYWKEQP